MELLVSLMFVLALMVILGLVLALLDAVNMVAMNVGVVTVDGLVAGVKQISMTALLIRAGMVLLVWMVLTRILVFALLDMKDLLVKFRQVTGLDIQAMMLAVPLAQRFLIAAPLLDYIIRLLKVQKIPGLIAEIQCVQD